MNFQQVDKLVAAYIAIDSLLRSRPSISDTHKVYTQAMQKIAYEIANLDQKEKEYAIKGIKKNGKISLSSDYLDSKKRMQEIAGLK